MIYLSISLLLHSMDLYVYVFIYIYICIYVPFFLIYPHTYACKKRNAIFFLGGFPQTSTSKHHVPHHREGREGVQRELAHRENNRFRRMSSTSIVASAHHFLRGGNFYTTGRWTAGSYKSSPQITHEKKGK